MHFFKKIITFALLILLDFFPNINYSKIMKSNKISLSLLGIIMSSTLTLSFCKSTGIGDDLDEQQKAILKNVRRILSYRHFQAKEFDDAFSAKAYDTYIEEIDPQKHFLTQEDIKLFGQHRDKMDDDINDLDLNFYNQSIDTLQNRIKFVKNNFEKLLDKPFDFTTNETMIIDEEKAQFSKDEKELLENWKKYLKYSTLVELSNRLEDQEKAKNKDKNKAVATAEKDEESLKEALKADGKVSEDAPKKAADSVFVEKSFAELEAEARKKVKEDYQDYFRRILQRDKKDFFESYVNAFAENFDPHTTYFSPKTKENFDFSISGKLEGIGASISDIKGYPTIKEIIIGSPSWKQGELKAGDKVLKVAQEGEKPVSVVGMKLDDAIRLIRGKKGTKVTLSVEKEDGSHKDITITRDVVEQEATFAKSAIIEDNKGGKYGFIHLPEFYFNPDNPKDRNAATDFYKELTELKKDNIQGLVIDLRDNGGGSLQTVVDIMGMFIDKGPVVQVKSGAGNENVLSDRDPSVAYDGNVIVLVNENSASASEILAAAMQDYHRAVIMGSTQTYGKGTVQSVVPVNFVSEELGALKLTIQKFYRVNGGSTQLEGVSSDIVVPGRYSLIAEREKENKSALPYDKINAATFTPWKMGFDLNYIEQQSVKRIAANKDFAFITQSAEWLEKMKNRSTVSLNFDAYQADKKEREAKADELDKMYEKYTNNMKIKSNKAETVLVAKDETLSEKRKKWHKDLNQDVEVFEAINVLRDMKSGKK